MQIFIHSNNVNLFIVPYIICKIISEFQYNITINSTYKYQVCEFFDFCPYSNTSKDV